MKDRIRYVIAVALGVLAIPGLAFASTAALTSIEDGEATTTTTTMAATDIAAADLVRACGVEGRYLVELEAAGTIDAVQQAALDALRPICDEASLPLPGPVVAGVSTPSTTVPGSADPGLTTTSTTTTTMVDNDFADALEARDKALVAIQAATDAGGNVDTINNAIAHVGDGDMAYEAGDFDLAEAWYEQAEDLANQAALDPEPMDYHDDDDEHEEDEDDDHDDDGHDDDGHEEDEDDDHDEDEDED